MNSFVNVIKFFIFSAFGLLAIAAIGVSLLYVAVKDDLPEVSDLSDTSFRVPLRIYSEDGKKIAEFGEQKRSPVAIDAVPDTLIKAILAAEDANFYRHPGVDYTGLIRAFINLVKTGEKGQGGSTITMQVARNFYLTKEKTYERKIREIFVSLQIERELSKDDILSLYINKIFLGHRAYGFAAAAHVYYGKSLSELTLAQLAMLAGLPKAPSAYNPATDPTKARQRRHYVLGRMLELGYITDEQHQRADTAPVDVTLESTNIELEASYVAEMVRHWMLENFGKDRTYNGGFKVYTTIDSVHQQSATQALRNGLISYTQRQRFRGPISHFDTAALEDVGGLAERLVDVSQIGGLTPAVVVELEGRSATFVTELDELVSIDGEAIMWAATKMQSSTSEFLSLGDVVHLWNHRGRWTLAQVPEVEGALVSLDPATGAIRSLVGGFDFRKSKFNRITQAYRQPGSNFKPFIYAAALEQGYTAASVINDAPIVFDDKALESTWRPENFSKKIYGPTRLRVALRNSRNLVSIRLLREMGVGPAISFAQRLGFEVANLPRDLSLALGSGSVTPLELVSGYSVFANSGYRTEPFFISRIEDQFGNVVFSAQPQVACDACHIGASDQFAGLIDPIVDGDIRLPAPRVVSPQVAFIMNDILADVVKRGTGRRALSLRRGDLAGKTGTTNGYRDAWFTGFNQQLLTSVWVGFDSPKTLGSNETGSRAALPIWVDHMRTVLDRVPELDRPVPHGIVNVRIDPTSGLRLSGRTSEGIFEIFRETDMPAEANDQLNGGNFRAGTGGGTEELLF